MESEKELLHRSESEVSKMRVLRESRVEDPDEFLCSLY